MPAIKRADHVIDSSFATLTSAVTWLYNSAFHRGSARLGSRDRMIPRLAAAARDAGRVMGNSNLPPFSFRRDFYRWKCGSVVGRRRRGKILDTGIFIMFFLSVISNIDAIISVERYPPYFVTYSRLNHDSRIGRDRSIKQPYLKRDKR